LGLALTQIQQWEHAQMATATHQRRRLDFRTMEEVLADVEQLRGRGYDRLGNWDLSQILDHVGEGLRVAVHGGKNKGPWAVRKIVGPFIFKHVLRTRRMRAGLKVPQWWLPGPAHDESEAVQKIKSAIDAFESAGPDLHPHPFFDKLSREKWTQLFLIHSSHHLSFLVPR
jgi:hypothetical protein